MAIWILYFKCVFPDSNRWRSRSIEIWPRRKSLRFDVSQLTDESTMSGGGSWRWGSTTGRKRSSHTKCVLHLWLALRVFHQVSLRLCLGHKRFSPAVHLQFRFQIHSQLHFQFRFRTPSRPRLLWQQLTVSVSRIVTSGGGSGRLSFWLLSPKNITNCCPLVDFTEPRWAFRDPNKLLIINWGKYAVIVAVASSTSFFLSFWLSGWQCPKIKWN